MKALSVPPGTARFRMGSMPKLTDMILSIMDADVNAYFGKSDEFCISAKKNRIPLMGMRDAPRRYCRCRPKIQFFVLREYEKSSTFLWSFSVSKKSPTCHCEERSDVAI